MNLHYKKLFVLSLLLVSMQQCFAIAPMQKYEQVQQELQDLDYPRYSTDKDMYTISSVEQPAEDDLVVAPVIISDKIVNNYFNNGKTRTLITQETRDGKVITMTETWKTRNPSYLTLRNGALVISVAAGAAITYLLMKESLRRADELEDMLKKHDKYNNAITSSELKLRQAKVNHIAESVGVSKVIRLDAPIVLSLIEDFSDEQLDRFIEITKNSKPLNTEDFIRIYEKIHDADAKSDDYSKKFNRELLKFGCNYSSWGAKYCTSIHEAGHSLVATKDSKSYSPLYATVVSRSGMNGHMMPGATDTWVPFYVNQSDGDQIKHNIDVYLGGPLSMAIVEEQITGKKLTFDEFLAHEKYGHGNFEYEGSDMFHAFTQAQDYFRVQDQDSWLPKTSLDQQEQDIYALLKERFEKTYNYLDARKDKLAIMTNQLYKHGVISDDKIHEIAGTKKPEYFADMSSSDCNVAIGLNLFKNAVIFHDTNPYEIHEVLG